MSKRQLLIVFTLIVLVVAAFVVMDANKRGQATTAGLAEIINRQPTDNPP